MSCRCEIVFKVDGLKKKELPVRIYQRYNGHPKQVIPWLKNFIDWNKKLNEKDSGCIAANYVFSSKWIIYQLFEKDYPEELAREEALNFYMPDNFVFVNWENEINSIVEYFYLVTYHHNLKKNRVEQITIEAGRGLPNSFKTGKFKAFDTITLKREKGEKNE